MCSRDEWRAIVLPLRHMLHTAPRSTLPRRPATSGLLRAHSLPAADPQLFRAPCRLSRLPCASPCCAAPPGHIHGMCTWPHARASLLHVWLTCLFIPSLPLPGLLAAVCPLSLQRCYTACRGLPAEAAAKARGVAADPLPVRSRGPTSPPARAALPQRPLGHGGPGQASRQRPAPPAELRR